MKYSHHPKYPNQIILKESKYWNVVLWENQYYLGRASIELKDMAKRQLSEISDEEAKELFYLIKWYEHSLIEALGTTHFNWTCLMNNSYKKKNINNTESLHLHVWPRYENKVEFEGEVFIDEVFGHHYDKHKEKFVDQELLIKIADNILHNC